ncbi:MAG: hypothetical protein QOD92_1823 [Acidimicrobiaceae bacterium]|jgi:hypothetical protein
MLGRAKPGTANRRRGFVARLALLVVLGILLAADVYANLIGDQSYDGGGDCGGKGCINAGNDRGYQIAFVLVALIGVVIAWPVLARRFREAGESSSL